MGASDVEAEPAGVGGEQRREAVGPFNEGDGGRATVVVPADGEQFFGAVDAVKVEMANCADGGGILLDEREGGAALELIRVVGECGDDAAGETGLA